MRAASTFTGRATGRDASTISTCASGFSATTVPVARLARQAGRQSRQQEQRTKFGAGNLDYVDYLTFRDKLGLLMAKATTHGEKFRWFG